MSGGVWSWVIGSAALVCVSWTILARPGGIVAALWSLIADAIVQTIIGAMILVWAALFVVVGLAVGIVRASFWIADAVLDPFWTVAERFRDRHS